MMIINNRKTATHSVTLECFDGLVRVEPTDVNTLVGGTGGEAAIALPVHVQCRRWGRKTRHFSVQCEIDAYSLMVPSV